MKRISRSVSEPFQSTYKIVHSYHYTQYSVIYGKTTATLLLILIYTVYLNFFTFFFPPPAYLSAMDLIYWKDMERTGMVLTGLVVGLLSLFQLSIIAVISTVSLAFMCFTISVRIYYYFLYILGRGDGEHPFKYDTFILIRKPDIPFISFFLLSGTVFL